MFIILSLGMTIKVTRKRLKYADWTHLPIITLMAVQTQQLQGTLLVTLRDSATNQIIDDKLQ